MREAAAVGRHTVPREIVFVRELPRTATGKLLKLDPERHGPVTGLPVGAEAPDFELRDQHGQETRLSSFRDERKVLLVFYPWVFSSVCSSELGDLRDAWPTFERHHVEILAISCDPRYAIRAYADRDGIGFPLLSDFWPHGAVSSAYGVFDEERGCARRSSFVVDKAGKVAWTVHNAMPDARNLHEYAEVLDRLG
jgi:peroxiredoxin